MNIEWEAVDKCPVCGGEGVPSISNLDPEINDTIYVYYCPKCHSAYHNPRMSRESMAEYYSSGTYREGWNRSLNDKNLKNKLAAAGLKIQMLEAFRKDVGKEVVRSLDYGCSRGYIVKELEKMYGGEVIGYDIYRDPEALIEVVDSKDDLTGKFDLITCIHVLEHLPNPIEELDWMVSMLSVDGLLFLEVPFARIVYPPHPILFSRESIFHMMKRLKARYIFYDMQYITNNGLVIAQPNHPTAIAHADYHPSMVGYYREQFDEWKGNGQ